MSSRKGDALRFRELIILTLQAAGVQGISMPKREAKKLSQAILEEQDRSDISGMPDWSIVTRIEHTRDISGGVSEAVREAELDGKTRAAAIWHRPGHNAGASFVVMELSCFAGLLVAEQNRSSS